MRFATAETMKVTRTFIMLEIGLIAMTCLQEVKCQYNESYLIREVLMKNYDSKVRPVLDPAQPVFLNLSIGIKNIIELDMKKQTLVSFGWITVTWEDRFLTWDHDKFGVSTVHLGSDMVWRPELVIFNTVKELDELEDQKIDVIVEHDGLVTWYPGGLFQTFCSIDISHYPMDTQVCSIEVIPWSLGSKFLNGTFADPTFELVSMENHPEWELIDTSRNYVMRTTSFWVISFTFVLRRKVLFYVINIVLPIVLLSLMNCLVFLLPVESGEKMTVSVTVFLSFAVFMSLISDSLPQNSDSLCLFSAYVAVQMLLSVCSIVMATLIVYVFASSQGESVHVESPTPSAADRKSQSSARKASVSANAVWPYTDPASCVSDVMADVSPAHMTTSGRASETPSVTTAVTKPVRKMTSAFASETCGRARAVPGSRMLVMLVHLHSISPLERRQLSRSLDKFCFVFTIVVNVLSGIVFIALIIG